MHNIFFNLPSSPAFVIDTDQVLANLNRINTMRQASGCKVLYAMKALPLAALLRVLKPHVDGIAVSSLFEARLAKQVLGEEVSLHLTTPGLRADEFAELAQLCSHISFNSLEQQRRLQALAEGYSPGLRINPKRSYLHDDRYNPCRQYSKLGIDTAELQNAWPESVQGLHLHTLFAAHYFQPLIETVHSLLPLLKQHGKLKWLNLGGGYLYNSITDQTELLALLDILHNDYAEQVFIEPGKAFVGNAGYLISTVLDSFISDGKTVLILDTSVNHHPEVFEYQTRPYLFPTEPETGEVAILAGSTCLAGDIFGEYRFKQLPKIGERIMFCDVGAYSLIKANRFNGYNLPDIYQLKNGQTTLLKQYDYADYERQWLV
ncbi:carboxynorspermidine decarboxylase [Methylomonas sp. AM2-LC]|uniref:carboxynorspermidine decarboxylase n=1 Tax=Methylomonas sp. AM2-LC TaxID=3153301 RepID=UPI0032652904